MEENRYAVGLDIGTADVKAVILEVAPREMDGDIAKGEEKIKVVGVGVSKNSGMRKGAVVDLDKTARAVDEAIAQAEAKSGFHADSATVSINGAHVVGLNSRGTVAVAGNSEVKEEDIARVKDDAAIVKIPTNWEMIDLVARSYKLDSQDNIREPLGMNGVRLELDAYIITALKPNVDNVRQVLEMNNISYGDLALPAMAAAEVCLSDQQKESGAAVIDFGATTTNIVIFEEGDVVYTKVLPVGSHNITDDLATELKVDLATAEKIKVENSVAAPELRRGGSDQTVKIDGKNGQQMVFETALIDEVVEARLAFIFELINKELKKIKKFANLPGGAVLVGGGANLRGIGDYAREILRMNVIVPRDFGFSGLNDKVSDPKFAAALGLAKVDSYHNAIAHSAKKSGNLLGFLGGIFRKK